MAYDLTGPAATPDDARRIRRLWLLPPPMLLLAVVASTLAWPHLSGSGSSPAS